MTEKSQQITFTKGITNQPSDAICSDGELSNCVGLTAEYGELKPIQNPKQLTLQNDGVPGAKILAVHDGRYIYESYDAQEQSKCLLFTDTSHQGYLVTFFKGNLKDVTTIGNTVIAATDEEMRYSLWVERPNNQSGYKRLGNKIPEPDLTLGLSDTNIKQQSVRVNAAEFISEGEVKPESRLAYNDAVVGAYSEVVKKLHNEKAFAEPFVARIAVELYDGSYTLHSNPFIMLPMYRAKLTLAMSSGSFADNWPSMYMKGYHITCDGVYDYSDWSDIVKNVTIFVSREVHLFNTSTDAKWVAIPNDENTILGYRLISSHIQTQGNWVDVSSYASGSRQFEVLDAVTDGDIIKTLKEESVFFKLCDLGLSSIGSLNTYGLYSYNVLDNIEAQQQLPNEDYHTHDDYSGKMLYAYNGRLHIAGAKRHLFRGFKHFFDWYRPAGSTITYNIRVRLVINGADKYVYQKVTTREAIGEIYFYYPDTRAKEVDIYNNGTLITTLSLAEHPGLNGACWFGGFPTYNASNNGYAPPMSPEDTPFVSPWAMPSEELKDIIMVSEVDNPFLFLAKGYVKVNAPVVGMAAVTMALSEYQHGHQPLVVFTEKGIWSLTLNSEGYYTSVQAVSREVCNNASSITQVDHGIYFVSQKGLMYLNTAGVKCVSDQMRGTEFDEFIDDCMIAYDYRDSLLHIYPKPNNAHGFGDTYVYNMKTGTFSTVQGAFTNVVNNYPDTLVQNSSYYAYSFMQRPDEQSDGSYSGGTFVFNTYNARIDTRPMKLENALALKTILQARHIHTIKFSQTTTLTFKVYASNNLDRDPNTWVQLTSLRGRPWKYYKFVYIFTGLKATDRFAGTMLITQERRTDKLR